MNNDTAVFFFFNSFFVPFHDDHPISYFLFSFSDFVLLSIFSFSFTIFYRIVSYQIKRKLYFCHHSISAFSCWRLVFFLLLYFSFLTIIHDTILSFCAPACKETDDNFISTTKHQTICKKRLKLVNLCTR